MPPLIRQRALEIAAENQITRFKASATWVKTFMDHFGLSVRVASKTGNESPESVEVRRKEFAKRVQAKMKSLDVDRVFNADQTSLDFEMSSNKTVDFKGAGTVWVRSSLCSTQRMSCMLLGDSLGNKYRPTVVFNMGLSKDIRVREANWIERGGFGKKSYQELKGKAQELGVDIYNNSTGFFSKEIVIEWLRANFLPSPKRRFLLLDKFSEHTCKEVQLLAGAFNIELMFIPVGLTAASQPADLGWNAAFKRRMRSLWEASMIKEVNSLNAKEPHQVKSLDRRELLEFVSSSWESVSEATVRMGFWKAGIGPAAIEGDENRHVTPEEELDSIDSDEGPIACDAAQAKELMTQASKTRNMLIACKTVREVLGKCDKWPNSIKDAAHKHASQGSNLTAADQELNILINNGEILHDACRAVADLERRIRGN